MDADMVKNIKAAESVLARQAAEELGDLPPGHPLQEEVERQRALLDGDLGELPENHPLRRALLEAKARMEQREQREAEQTKTAEVRKAKRLEAKKVRRAQRDAEEERIRLSRDSMATVNAGIDQALDAMHDLTIKIEENAEQISTSQLGRASMMRLQRLVQASTTALQDARLRSGRI
jgi:hypothetical protein